jgi:chromosomal replication initiator protein
MTLSWPDVLQEVSKQIPPMYYDPFILPLSMENFDRERLVLRAPSAMVKDHVIKKYQHFIEDAVERVLGNKVQIEILADKESKKPLSGFVEDKFNEDIYHFNPEYTFQNFHTGESNLFAFSACKEVAQKPGSINPLYIFGKVGTGKTHLLQAIGSAIQKIPGQSVRYIPISSFLSEFVYNVQNKQNIEGFRSKYQSYTTLIIDDIHQLNSSAEKTQEEFFHLFNYLSERKRQIIIASDRPIHELPLQDKLRSRFATGYQVEIRLPDPKVRESIIVTRSRELSLELTKDSVSFIKENFRSDIRSLIGCLNELTLYKKTYNVLILPEDKIKDILESRLEKHGRVEVPSEKILDVVCEYYSQEKSNITSKSRRAEYIIPRHISMYLLFDICKLNKTTIGKMFQTKHTTIISAIKKINDRMKKDPNFKRIVEGFKKRFEFQ